MRRRGSFFTFPFSSRRSAAAPPHDDARMRDASIGDVLAAVQRIDPDEADKRPRARGNVAIFTPPVTAHALPADAAREEHSRMHGKNVKSEAETGQHGAEAGREEGHLISDAAEAATVATLTELARRSRTDKSLVLPGGERTLEQVVREAVAEHLSGWLDANLPSLVERVVRDEVRRLTRRAEDS
jgi:hypothetical protein